MDLQQAYELVLADLCRLESETLVASDEAFAKFDLFKDVSFQQQGLKLFDEVDDLRTAHRVLSLVKRRYFTD